MRRVFACYFSPCGNVERTVRAVAQGAAGVLGLPAETVDFTLPEARTEDIVFDAGDLVILGTPVYAGRVPNKLMPYVRDHIHGNGALCAAVVCFGNRAFDDALAELFLLAKDNGFAPIAAAAVVTEHSFSSRLAPGSPTAEELAVAAAGRWAGSASPPRWWRPLSRRSSRSSFWPYSAPSASSSSTLQR